eukprot:TRINITY_DN4524_c0_g1_i5.p2 TRINITY_DN4524_c0_g1~~TRINITY_DN4524_c0_g1_i5.p2  ORF type:complete len:124 (-),score=36.20 TRINITY_DN4524_c0_g1_i5:7-378(-)
MCIRDRYMGIENSTLAKKAIGKVRTDVLKDLTSGKYSITLIIMRAEVDYKEYCVGTISEDSSIASSTFKNDEFTVISLSLIHISEPTRPLYISYAVFCLKKKKKIQQTTKQKPEKEQAETAQQ